MKLLILDIDDTFFDWLTMWGESFEALLASLAVRSAVARADRLATFRQLHMAARTAERGITATDASALGITVDTAIELAFEHEVNLKARMTPFPCACETLQGLVARGVRIVAHTDTPMGIAADRFVHLGLDGLVEALFAPTSDGVTFFRSTPRVPTRAQARVVPYSKPDPRCVEFILGCCGVAATDATYLGDSKMKDIPMARSSGVRDVFAAYGCRRSSEAYDLLRAVSHWTDEDIARERALLASEATHSVPSFEAVLELF